jgi:NADH dehydrogenase/NADH:ubiquinone oxidoreductase subunit G
LFIRFGVSEVILLFGSKNKIVLKLFLKTINPIIISGKSLIDRIDFNSLNYFLTKNQSVLNYTIHTRCNEESIEYFNFDSYNNKDVNGTKNLYFLNLEDSLNLRQLLLNNKKDSVNFASHVSKLIEYASLTISVLIPQETGGLFLNLEKRPQYATPLAVKKSWGVVSFQSFFSSLITLINSKNKFISFVDSRKYLVRNQIFNNAAST